MLDPLARHRSNIISISCRRCRLCVILKAKSIFQVNIGAVGRDLQGYKLSGSPHAKDRIQINIMHCKTVSTTIAQSPCDEIVTPKQ